MSGFGTESREYAIHDVLKKIHATGALFDFILAVGGKEWKVHKLVLMMHSDVLFKMSTNEHFVESKTGRAVLKEVEADQVEALVHYMYHGHYLNPDGSEAFHWPGIISLEAVGFHISMVAISDRYNVPELHEFALECVETAINRTNVLEMAKHFYDSDQTPDSVRKKMVRTISGSLEILHNNVDYSTLLDEMPHLAVDVLKAVSHDMCASPSDRWGWGPE